MDPDPPGFGTFGLDPDPEFLFWIRIQQKMKEPILFLNLGRDFWTVCTV